MSTVLASKNILALAIEHKGYQTFAVLKSLSSHQTKIQSVSNVDYVNHLLIKAMLS